MSLGYGVGPGPVDRYYGEGHRVTKGLHRTGGVSLDTELSMQQLGKFRANQGELAVWSRTSPQIRPDQISRSVVSDSLRPHESQHARPPVHHQLPEFTQTHIHRVSDAIQPSHPLSSPSPLAPNPSQHQSLFQ